MIVDSHQHFWHFDPAAMGWVASGMKTLRRDWLPEDLVPCLTRTGVERTIVVQATGKKAENEFLMRQAAACDWIAGVVGWVDLAAADAEERIMHWQQSGPLVGIRHQIENDPACMLDKQFNSGVSAVQRRGLVYEVLVKHSQLRRAIAFCDRHDVHALVVDHLAKPPIMGDEAALSAWRNEMSELAMMPHVFVKLSGLVTEAQGRMGEPANLDGVRRYMDMALELFGENRLLFGSDWPVCRLATTYADWFSLVDSWAGRQGAECRRRVLGANAVAVYGLKD